MNEDDMDTWLELFEAAIDFALKTSLYEAFERFIISLANTF